MKSMKHLNLFVNVLLLLSCYSFADSNKMKGYPDKIKCVMNSYFLDFSTVSEQSVDIENGDGFWWGLFRDEAKKYRIQLKSINVFSLERENGTTENGIASTQRRFRTFKLEIWAFETSEDANKIMNLINGYIYFGKPPKQYFVYKNFIILLVSASSDSKHVIQKAICEIIQTCFECSIMMDVGGASFEEIRDCCTHLPK